MNNRPRVKKLKEIKSNLLKNKIKEPNNPPIIPIPTNKNGAGGFAFLFKNRRTTKYDKKRKIAKEHMRKNCKLAIS